MKRKPLEKLSDRLVKLFLANVKTYDYLYFGKLTSTTEACTDYAPLDLAQEMTRRCMKIIAEYKGEDIE